MTAWELTALESEYGSQFLSSSYSTIGHILDRTWTTTLWEFLDYFHITLKMQSENPYRNKTDFYIMSKVATFEKQSELKWFNFCRIYLQVELLF